MSYIPGLDVWHGYGNIDWKKVAAAGYRFVWAKCSVGNEPQQDDPAYERYVKGAQDAGLAVGAYLFPFPLPTMKQGDGRSPIEQVERFAAKSKLLGSRAGELSPMIDLEWPAPQDWAKWGCTAEQISEWGKEACEAITLLWGRLPVIYHYPWWEKAIGTANDHWAGRYPLCMAAYTHPGPGVPPDGKSPPVPPPWTEWAAWQHSADGSPTRVPGVPVAPLDRQCIRDEATFRLLTGCRQPETIPAPPDDTEPVEVPSIPPRDGARTVTPWDIARPRVPLGRPALDGEDPEDPSAA